MQLQFRSLQLCLVIVLVLSGCAGHARQSLPAPQGAIAFVGDYFDGKGDVVRDGVVVIDKDTIHCAGTKRDCGIGQAARTIRVTGGMILPGFIDLHVHARPHYLTMFPAAGVTTIRDANNTLETIAALNAIPGAPRIVAAGPMLDGPESVINSMSETEGFPGEQAWESIMPVLIATPEQARKAVAALAERGTDVIKLYEQLSPAAFEAAVDEAHRRGLPVMTDLGLAGTRGLTRAQVDALQAAGFGADSIEHLSGFALAYRRLGGDPASEHLDPKLLDAMAAEIAKTGTAVVPTLVNTVHLTASEPPDLSGVPLADVGSQLMGGWWKQLFGMVHGEEMHARGMIDHRFARELMPRLVERGVLVGAGTDTPAGPYTVPGGGLHQELAALVDFGLSPLEALRAATGNAARILGRDDLGVIRKGAKADLVVVSGDPSRRIADSRKLEWIVLDGEVRQADEIQSRVRRDSGGAAE